MILNISEFNMRSGAFFGAFWRRIIGLIGGRPTSIHRLA